MNELNEKGEYHGYWEEYWSNGELWYKTNFINGVEIGYCEIRLSNGDLFYKGFYL